jgi:general secretion pathway protein E
MKGSCPVYASIDEFNLLLAEAITGLGVMRSEDLARAVSASRQKDRLDQTILRLGLCEEKVLLQAVCKVLRCQFLDSNDGVALDSTIVDRLTTAFCTSHLVAPIQHNGRGVMIAVSDPANQQLVAEMQFFLDDDIILQGATASSIRQLLNAAGTDVDQTAAAAAAVRIKDEDRLREAQTEGPVIRYVQDLLADAVTLGASDIHIENTVLGLSIRYRINGILQMRPSNTLLPPDSIIARFKVMAEVNVAEKRLPQDGRIDTLVNGRKVDFRFSSIPTQWGESIVCRILDPKALRLGWQQLGIPKDIVDRLTKLLQLPSGLILVTGPTGSGKTTTLYTALSSLNDPRRKIITVEDPVEYNLDGIQQVQIHEEIGLTFPRVLRSILRHDPNIILVGEIRDQETAEIAIRAAQVGRLVLSTLHTNSAKGAFHRLIDLGAQDFLVSDVLRGVLSQELMIQSCASCGGMGCVQCGHSGVGARRLKAELWIPEG